MIDVLRRGLWLALIAGVVFTGACSSDGGEGAGAESAGTETPMASGEGDAPMVDSGGMQDPGDQDAGFSRQQDEARAVQDKKDTLVSNFLLAAQGAMNASRLEDAEKYILQAMDVHPESVEAKDMLRRVRSLRGDNALDDAQLAAYIQAKRRLVSQQQVALVNDHMSKADRAQANGDWAEAKKELERAQLIIKFDPYQTDFGTRPTAVAQSLNLVEVRLEEARRADQAEAFERSYDAVKAEEARQAEKRQDHIERLLVQATEAFIREEFDTSEALAQKILRMDGGVKEAKELVNNSRQARHSAWRQSFLKQRKEQYQTWLEQVRETQIPYTSVLTWPNVEEWDRLTELRANTGDAVDRAQEDSDAVARIKRKLENDVITLDPGDEEMLFGDVIKTIRATMNINIVVDPEVKIEKEEEPVNFAGTDIRLGTALETILTDLELAHTFRNDVLYITTKEKALGMPVPRVYEVRDLTISLPNFAAPDLTVRPGPAGEAAQRAIFGEEQEPTVDTTLDRLVDIVRQTIAPESWDLDGFVLEPAAGKIVAVTTPEIHARVERFLDDLRRFTKLTVHVEARFISINKGSLQDIGFDFRDLGGSNPGTVALLDDVTNGAPSNASAATGNGGPGLPGGAAQSPAAGVFYSIAGSGDARARTENIFDRTLGQLLSGNGGATLQFSLLDDTQISGILRAVEQQVDNSVITAPRLTIFNNQRANLTLVNQVSYVKDYDVEVAQTAFIADPLVDVIQDGLTLDVRPTVSHDRKYVTLEVQPTVATLLRPIRTFETNLAGITTPVVIELPEIRYSKAQTTVKVPDGGYVIIGGLKHIRSVDRRSETPILSNIPLISFFFSRKGRSDEIRDLIIVLHVRILDLSDIEENLIR